MAILTNAMAPDAQKLMDVLNGDSSYHPPFRSASDGAKSYL